MRKVANNFAFIDGNNLHMALRDLGWKLDHGRFRVYLREHYSVTKAYYFVGFVEENARLYKKLQEAGFILIFKPTIRNGDGIVKGNVDAELVLQAMIDFAAYEEAILVTGDGDFACLVRHLDSERKLCRVLVPNQAKYSGLLKKAAGSRLVSVDVLRDKLEYRPSQNEKHPARTEP